MSKQEFLINLSRLLASISKDESDKILEYFAELIDDKVENGETEQNVVSELGNINELANTIIAEYKTNNNDKSSLPNKYIAEISTFDISQINNICSVVHNRSIEIFPIDSNTITISYYTADYDMIKCTCNGSTISISSETKAKAILYNLFNIMAFKYYKIKICLPISYIGSLNMETSNASIKLTSHDKLNIVRLKTSNSAIFTDNLAAQSMDLNTNNGRIEINNLNIATDLTAKTNNSEISILSSNVTGISTLRSTCGSIKIDSFKCCHLNATTTNSSIILNNIDTPFLCATSSNGKIDIDNIVSNSIDLKTSNSKISGYVCGNQADYNILTSTCNGHVSPLPATGLCREKVLTAKTSNGTVNIQFK